MENQTETSQEVTQEAQVEVQEPKELGPVGQMLKTAKERKLRLARRKQTREFRLYFERVKAAHDAAQLKVERELTRLEGLLGKEDFKMLKDICMVDIPEEKNEQGEIVKPAKRELNKQALLVEARHLIILKREDRIKKGLRKRSSGRRSVRKNHSAMVRFLTKRNEEQLAQEKA